MHTLITFLLAPSILFALILVGGILSYTGYREWQADRNNWRGN